MARIFMVEDNPAMIKTVQEELRKWQYDVQTVTDWGNVAGEVTAAHPALHPAHLRRLLLDAGGP